MNTRTHLVTTGLCAALLAAGTGVLAGPAAAATGPAPVSGLHLSSKDSVVYVDWTPSPDTTDADVCWSTAAPPSTPSDPGASCSGTLTAAGYSFAATKGQQYGVSVFSYDAGTNTYGTPVSGSITAVDEPPLAPVDLRTGSQGAHRLYLYWQDNPANDDTKDYIVDWQRGTGVPPVDAGDGHVTTYPSFEVEGLADGTVYTFAVRARDAVGQMGPAVVVRAATRAPGIYLRSDDAAHGLASPTGIGYGSEGAVATMAPDAHLRVVYRNGNQLYYVSRKPNAAKFGHFTQVSRHVTGDAALAASPADQLLVVWPTDAGLHYRFRSSTTWAAERTLTTGGADLVLGATYDGRHAHVLALAHQGSSRGLWLYSLVGGRWHSSQVPGTAATDAGALTQDPKTGDVVVVDRHQAAGSSRLRVAVVPAGATSVAKPATWATVSGAGVDPTSVASVSGRVTIGVQRSGGGTAGPYLLRGDGRHHGGLVRVAGTSGKDENLVVTALQPDHVVVSWRRTSASWSPDDVGVWVSQAVQAKSGRWHFTTPHRWTTSAYDFPVSAFRSNAGHLYAVYDTVQGDVSE